MCQRLREIVPLDVVANHRTDILGAMRPLYSRPAFVRMSMVSENDEDRRSGDECIVDGHRRML